MIEWTHWHDSVPQWSAYAPLRHVSRHSHEGCRCLETQAANAGVAPRRPAFGVRPGSPLERMLTSKHLRRKERRMLMAAVTGAATRRRRRVERRLRVALRERGATE